jgi:agarase
MRRVLVFIAACLLLTLGLAYPYHSAGNIPAATTRPTVIATETTHPSPLRQMRGEPGYWRLAQDQAGVWWWVSPAGKLEFLNTVTTVQPVQDGRERNSVRFISRDWDGRDGPQDINRWASATLNRVFDYGFKGLGAWCNPAFHSLDVPMSQDLNLWAWVTDSSKRFYSPEWAPMAEQAVRAQVPPLRNNPNLLGYFLDNELDWGDGFAGPSAYFDDLPPSDPNRREVMQTIHWVWPHLDEFNNAWNCKLTAWSQVDMWTSFPREQADAYNRLSSAWLSHLARDYFKLTTTLVRKYDPNHLILGVRFKGFAPEQVVAASRDYTDAESLNYYVSDARLDSDMFRMMYQRSGQPIIISEYSFHSMDGHSGNLDTVGFNAQVPDQQARADGYRLMTTRLARVPYIVGADWFQWCDEPPTGRSSDGEDVNFGIVDVHDRPYNQLIASVRETTPLLNPLHERSAADSESDIWRESYAIKPVKHVPFLVHPPVLDGDLTQWSPASALDGIRRDQTVGLDRVNMRTPDVFMGWTNEGLYFALQVYDHHIETAPATSWWWTRDNIELFLSTRPVTSNEASYDVNCHQFFVVPADPGAGNEAIVGQWHRDGDALKDNLIPDPLIKKVVKILPDRYVVEMFIPAQAMHNYNPSHQPQLAFNLHVRDFTSAADFFWSAPKSSRTELRPNTWGTLYLDPPTSAIVPALARTAQLSMN